MDKQVPMDQPPSLIGFFEAIRNSGWRLPEAIAELVDNSIDAGARNIMVRFVRTSSSLEQLQIIDDGQGMTEAEAREAMRFGVASDHPEDAPWKFGVGLKLASISSAGSLTVISKTRRHGTVGLRWNIEEMDSGATVEILDPEWAEAHLPMLDDGHGPSHEKPGTLIEWDRVRDFSRVPDLKVSPDLSKSPLGVDGYLERTVREVRRHLGLHFHRFIERGETKICIDSFNLDTDQRGLISEVTALNPFGYQETAVRGYPRAFRLTDEEHGDLELSAHIWPPRSTQDEFRLDGSTKRQGLYFYRNNRLLHGGGWCDSRSVSEPHLSLARVAIDLPMSWQSVIHNRLDGSGIAVPEYFTEALREARSLNGDLSFETFLEDATTAYRDVGHQTAVETLDTTDPAVPDSTPILGIGVAALTAIELWNFKSVHMARVGLKPLTVLVGMNSSGKSSLIESILMRAQAGIGNPPTEVPLNGNLVRLGTFTDVLNNTFDDSFNDVGEEDGFCDWMFGEDCLGFRIGGELFISRHGLQDVNPARAASAARTRRHRLTSTRRPGKLLANWDYQTIGGFDPLGDDDQTTAGSGRHLYPGRDSLSPLKNPEVQTSLGKLLERAADRHLTGTPLPDDQGLTLRWRMEVTDPGNNQESFATARGALIQILDRGDVLLSVDTRFDSFEASQDLHHIDIDEKSEWFVREKPAILGVATHPGFGEEEIQVVDAQPLNGLPAAIRYARDAKTLITENLLRSWIDKGSRFTAGGPHSTGRHARLPLPHRMTFQRVLSALTEGPDGPESSTEWNNEYREVVAMARIAFEEGRLRPDQIEQIEEIPDWSWDWDPEALGQREAQFGQLVLQAAHWVDFYLKELKEWCPRIEEGEEIFGFSEDAHLYFTESGVLPVADLATAREFAPGMSKNIVDLNSGDKGVRRATRRGGPPIMDPDLPMLRRLSDLDEGSRRELVDQVVAATTAKTKFTGIVADPSINSLLRALSLVARNFIRDRVYFVGPLREAPRSHYDPPPDGSRRWVGQRGEYTAALLAQLGGTWVWSPRPYGEHEIERLDEALSYWLGPEGLGLVTKVLATPVLGSGYRLEVQPLGMEKLVPISAVGTGVSQILPVLVQGLIAPPSDALLLLQQPELHLHPALQQGLADFLLALVQSGRRVILETHSEHLVSRLARRVVDPDEDEALDHIGLELVALDDEEGTTYQPAEIDSLGTINWPVGFFEESSEEALETLKAGLERMDRSESAGDLTGK